jgi:hypothetical protein
MGHFPVRINMSKPQLTDQACPHCLAPTGGGNSDIGYNPEHPYQFMECDICGTTWQVEYSVTAIDNIEVPTPRQRIKNLPVPE